MTTKKDPNHNTISDPDSEKFQDDLHGFNDNHKLMNQKPAAHAAEAGPDKPKVNIATFRGIPKELHEKVKETAAELGVAPGELARYFLETGLDRLDAGEEVLTPAFVPGGYTLYPEEGHKRPRRKALRKPKSLQQPRSYYGVPREVVQQVLDKSKEIGVTQGELARYLFERGVNLFRAGKLDVKPVPVQQIATLYPKEIGEG